MLPTPETTVWLSSSRLIPELLRRTRCTNTASSKSSSIGSRAMCAISGGSTRSPVRDGQPAEHALVDEPELQLGRALGAGSEDEADAQVPFVGYAGRLHQHLAAHAEVPEQGVAVVEGEPEVLPAAVGRR